MTKLISITQHHVDGWRKRNPTWDVSPNHNNVVLPRGENCILLHYSKLGPGQERFATQVLDSPGSPPKWRSIDEAAPTIKHLHNVYKDSWIKTPRMIEPEFELDEIELADKLIGMG